MQNVMPGKFIDPKLMVAGPLIKEQADIVNFQHRTTYADIFKLLHKRVKARSGMTAPSEAERFFCRVVLLIKNKSVLLEHESWPAARELVFRHENATLLFLFTIMPRSYSGPTVLERVKRMFMEVEHKICLVEPDLPVHPESTRIRHAHLTTS